MVRADSPAAVARHELDAALHEIREEGNITAIRDQLDAPPGGPRCRAVGTTDDGVIEALDAEFEHPFFYAVQSHPEALPATDPVSARLFGGLVRAATAARANAAARA